MRSLKKVEGPPDIVVARGGRCLRFGECRTMELKGTGSSSGAGTDVEAKLIFSFRSVSSLWNSVRSQAER
jgi:hypothetical protein